MFKALYLEKNAYEFIIAYPSDSGLDSEDQLYTWEQGDVANRELFMCKNKKEAKELYNHYQNDV
jgi:hypothetical protein